MVTLSSFPKELIQQIFTQFENPSDFYALARITKLFHQISQDPKTHCYWDPLPTFLRKSQNPAIRNLPFWQKQKMAKIIDGKFNPFKTGSSAPPFIFKVDGLINRILTQPLKLIIGNLFIYPEDNYIYIHSFDTKAEKTEKILDLTNQKRIICPDYPDHRPLSIEKCLGIHGENPLLITQSRCLMGTKIEIWNLKKLLSDAEKKAIPEFSIIADKVLSIETYGHLLAVAFPNGIKIWDCSKPLTENGALTFEFNRPLQITFSDSYLMVVEEEQVTLLKSSDYSHHLKLPTKTKISKAIIHQNKLIIAFASLEKSNEEFLIGEVRNLLTGELSKQLILKENSRILAMECSGKNLCTVGEHSIAWWNLASSKTAPISCETERFNDYSVGSRSIDITIYTIGLMTLFVSKGKDIRIKRGLQPGKTHQEHFLFFQIQDQYLITERTSGPGQKVTCVYNLAKEE